LAPGGRHPSSGGAARLGRWRGEVLLVDCRRDYIDCRLNIHYPLDAIFRPSLILPKTDAGRAIGLALSQRSSDWVMTLALRPGVGARSIRFDKVR